MDTRKGKILAVVDLENFIGCIGTDPALQQYPSHIAVRATTSAIRQVASRQYPDCTIEWLITAFSLPDPQSDGYQREINQITLATLEANRLGFQVLSVKRDENSADCAITQLGSALLFDRRIKICMLATQDSGGPFVSFINTVSQRTQMHLLGYDYIPQSFPPESMISSSLLKGSITEIIRQMQPNRATNPHHRTATSIRESTYRFLNNPDFVTDPLYRAWIIQAIACVRAVAQDIQEETFTFSHLVRGVRSRWRGPFPPDKEFGDILNTIKDKFFSQRHILIYRPGEMILFLQKFPDCLS